MARIPEEIEAFYNSGDEAGRLSRGIAPLEEARTRELMERFLPVAPAVVCDVGSGPGAYSFWLAERGYEVHMVDAVEAHVRQARERAVLVEGRKPVSIEVGDARELRFANASADAVILHGPLYHLCERGDRIKALVEARRVLRKGGVVLAFAVTRYASVVVGLTRGWIFDADYVRMCEEEIATGKHRRPESWPKLFTTAYFHHVHELQQEIMEAGFVHERTLSVQGPGWLALQFEEAWKDQAKRAVLMKVARAMENEPAVSPHMMAVGRA